MRSSTDVIIPRRINFEYQIFFTFLSFENFAWSLCDLVYCSQEDILATDDLFLNYFNEFLALPVCSLRIYFIFIFLSISVKHLGKISILKRKQWKHPNINKYGTFTPSV